MALTRRPPALLAYLSLGAISASAQKRRLATEIARGGPEATRLAERLGQPSARRPEGPLVWLHAGDPAQEGALAELARQLAETVEQGPEGKRPEPAFLLTTEELPGRDLPLPARGVHQLVPQDAGAAVGDFLDHWRPDVVIWAGARLRPAALLEAARRGVELILIDAAGAPSGPVPWRRFSGLGAATLRRFARILATDEAAARALAAAGADPAAIEVAGPLDEEVAALPCSPRERDALGAVLQARPVWFAAAVPEPEEAAVIAAHAAAARLAHRLLLILAPADPARGPALAERLAEAGLAVARRSAEGEPEPGSEVFLADSEGEYGLWYRLAPVSFMGGTLTSAAGGGRPPAEAAALGSAIMHGPETGRHAAAYRRLGDAGACRRVGEAAALGEALSDLLSPDRAASLAHAAWRISTGGAELAGRVGTLVAAALARRGAG
jgi:3-deoxy-D-manno-octulosonic-acid transferase